MRYEMIKIGVFAILCAFGWNAPGQTPTITLNVEEVLKHCRADTRIQALYQARQALATAEYEKAKKWWWPTLYGGLKTAGLAGTAQNTDGRFFRDLQKHNLWAGVGVDAEWNLKDKYAAEAKSWQTQALAFAKQADEEELLLKAIDKYYAYIQEHFSFLAYVALAGKASDIADQYAAQLKRGLKSKAEYTMAKTQVKSLEFEALDSYTKMKHNEAALVALLGLSPETEIESIDTVLLPITLVDTEKPDWGEMLAKDPRLHQLEAQVKGMQEEAKRYTKGKWLPKLYFNANGGLFGGTFNPFDPTGIWRAGAVWEIPLHQLRGNADARISQARITALEATASFIRQERQTTLAEAFNDIHHLDIQMEIAEASRDYAVEAFELVAQRQKNGIASPLELFQAQEQVVKTSLNYIRTVAAYNAAQYRLLVLRD